MSIRIVLAEKELTHKKLAADMGVTRGTVSKWCRNEQQPSVENLFKIAKVLKVSVRLLLVDDMEK